MAPDPIRIVILVSEIFQRLDIPHFVGGSIASSLMGESRTTEDVDFVADLDGSQIAELVVIMQGTFYLDEAAIRDAVRRRSPFNLIHLDTMTKVDVYPVRDAHVIGGGP